MKKTVVTAAVTSMFVAYSLFQRTLGADPTADLATSPSVLASAPTQAVSSRSTPAPAPATAPVTRQRIGRSDDDDEHGFPSTSRSTAPQPAPAPAPPTVVPSPQPAAPASQPVAGSALKDGTYTGTAADAHWGSLQVQATIAGGKLTAIQFPLWPSDRSRSVRINQQALPMLVQEAIQAQNASVNVVSGATDSSRAFVRSLQSALGQARNASAQADTAAGQSNG